MRDSNATSVAYCRDVYIILVGILCFTLEVLLRCFYNCFVLDYDEFAARLEHSRKD